MVRGLSGSVLLLSITMSDSALPTWAAEPEPTPTAPAASARRYVTASFVRMRERPSKDAPVIDLLPWGTEVDLVSPAADGDYQMVQLRGSGRRGAVASAYLSATPPTRRGTESACLPGRPACFPTLHSLSIDALERSERRWDNWSDAFGTWYVALGERSPYATQSSVDALNASPLFGAFEPAPVRPRTPYTPQSFVDDPAPRFTDPPRDAQFVPPTDLAVGRVVKLGESWTVQLEHPPSGAVRLSPDRRSVVWEEPRKAIVVSTCSPGFVELDVTVSADLGQVATLVTPRDVPPGTLACLQGKDVTYGSDVTTVALVVLDQGGLPRLRQALAGTTAVRTDYGGRSDVFEIRFQKDGRTQAAFRGLVEQSCGSMDPTIQFRVGEQWEQVAAKTFGDAC